MTTTGQPNTDPFIERASSEILTLERRDATLADSEDQIRRERAEIKTRLLDLARLVAVYRDFMGLSAKAGLKPSPMFPEMASSSANGSTATRTMADIAEDFMREHGGRAKMTDLLAEMRRVGRLHGKDNDYGSLFGTLKRNEKRFRKAGPGEFELVS